jgi:DTW domain-containing protein YfiP
MSRYCLKCGKAKKACLCAWIEFINTDFEIIILQHPSEVNRAKGTAKILTLSLNNTRLFVGEDFSQHSQLNQLLSEDAAITYLLFPSNDSLEVSPDLRGQISSKTKIRVILLDGTWKKAFKMYKLSCNLHRLPSLHLPEGLVGNYRIRKAPNDNSLSTAEAGFHLLTMLDPDTNYTPLLTTFNAMIEFYIQQLPEGTFEKNYTQ